MSFKALKKNRTKMLDTIKNKSSKEAAGNSYPKDERFFELTKDKAGTGSAIIRFLPPSHDNDDAWITFFSHGFEGTSGWFVENCPTTLGKDCPVCEDNSTHWNKGDKKSKDFASSRKRGKNFVSNILVVDDPENPENNGKVFLLRYGKQVFDIINDAMYPKFEDEDNPSFVPFDFWEGANFRFRIYKKDDGYSSYQKSKFDSPSALSDDDDYLEEIYNMQHDLSELIAPDKFKSYEDLQDAFQRVYKKGSSKSEGDSIEDEVERAAAPKKEKSAPTPKEKDVEPDELDEDDFSWKDDSDDDEYVEDYFAKLGKDDDD